jgi:hypothetical protein
MKVGGVAPDLTGVVHEIAAILDRYQVRVVTGDRYAADWGPPAFKCEHVHYQESALDRSAAYLELEPLLATGAVELLDHPTMLQELKNLERRNLPGAGHASITRAGCAPVTTTRTPAPWPLPTPRRFA